MPRTLPDDLLPHERPLTLLLPPGLGTGEALRRALARPEIAGYHLPAPWFLEAQGLPTPPALAGLRALTPERLPQALAALESALTPERLAAHAASYWLEVDEQVRQHFLRRGALATLAGIFRVGPRSIDLEPPPEFVEERVHACRLEVVYRLAADRGGERFPAPPEEGSLVAYPFDPHGRIARRGTEFEGEDGGALEVFAYVWQHGRHRTLWSAVAEELGARLL